MGFEPDLLKGKAALVTGGGTGICRGLSLALATHGCDVAITSRKPDHLEPTRREIEALGVRGLAVAGDVRDPAAVDAAVAQTVDAFGRLDILVNGAAGNFLCRAEDLSPNAFGAVVDIDLKGTFHMCRAALPHLKKQGGVVLNISATLHYFGTAAQLHVSAAKAGRRRADPRARRRVGGVRHPRQRHRARADRRYRGGAPPPRRTGEGPGGGDDAAPPPRRHRRRLEGGALPLLGPRVVRQRGHPGGRRRALADVEPHGRGVGPRRRGREGASRDDVPVRRRRTPTRRRGTASRARRAGRRRPATRAGSPRANS